MFTLTVPPNHASLPWVEKYRPSHLEELASHGHILETLAKFIESGKLPHLLFYGPPGTGKTTTILACARKLFGNSSESISSNVLELNASDDRGIDVVREQIKTFASTKNIFNAQSTGFKLVILDEADSMTNAAQDALRRVIEKYVKYVRFCLVCNDISKVTPAIQSRCTLFRFAPLPKERMKERLDLVIEREHLTVTPDGKEAILKIAGGDMRKVLNMLQSTAAAHPIVDESQVYACASLPTPAMVERVVHSLLNLDFDACYIMLRNLAAEHGFSLMDVLKAIYDLLLTLKLPNATQIYLFERLADLELDIAAGGHEQVHLGALIGTFELARGLVS